MALSLLWGPFMAFNHWHEGPLWLLIIGMGAIYGFVTTVVPEAQNISQCQSCVYV